MNNREACEVRLQEVFSIRFVVTSCYLETAVYHIAATLSESHLQRQSTVIQIGAYLLRSPFWVRPEL